MAFDRYLAAAPALGVSNDSIEEAAKNAANYQKSFQESQKVAETPKLDATIVQGKAIDQWKLLPVGKQPPKFIKSDFGYAARDDKDIPSYVNNAEALGSTVEFQDIGEGQTISVVSTNAALLNVNHSLNNGADASALATLTQKQRQATLMKMVIDGQFAKNVKVDEDVAKEAAAMWATPTNVHRLYDIEKAWALVKQNTAELTDGINPNSTIDSDRFSYNFHRKNGYSPSEYLRNGYVSGITGLPKGGIPGAEEDMEAERAKLQTKVDELTKTFYEQGEIKNPFIEKMAEVSKEYERNSAILATINAKTGAFKGQKQIVDDLSTKMTMLNTQSDAWANERTNGERMLEQGRKALNELQERINGGQSKTQIKAGLEVAGSLGKYKNRWTGLDDKSIEQHFGYSPAAYDSISPDERLQYIIDKNIKREPGESAVSFNRRRSVIDRADTPELMRYLAKRDPEAFVTMSEKLPDDDSDAKSKLTTETMVNQSYHFNKLNFLNQKLINGGYVEGFMNKVANAEMKEAASSRAQLIGQMRVFIVGPGNPSNFEQEILHSIIPEIEAIFSVSGFHKARLRALAMISILAHHNEKIKLGYKANDTSMELYNARFGEMLGRKLTLDELNQFRDFSAKEANTYNGMKKYGNIDVGDRQGSGYTGNGKTTKAFGNEYFNKVEQMFGK